MDERYTVLILLFTTVVVSGCIGGGSGGQTSSGAMTISGPTVQPSSIFAGSNVRVMMGVANTGELPATLGVGENGLSIMKSSCQDIFDIQSFSAESSNISSTQEAYDLAPGYEVKLNWNMKQSTGEVPLNGLRCDLRFEVPFNYSVESFRQIQIKQSERVENAKLFSQSSKGPLDIKIEAIGSSASSGAPVFLKDDGAEVLIRIVNRRTEASRYQGLVELDPPALTARGIRFGEVDITSENLEVAKNIADELPDIDEDSLSAGDSVRMCPDPDELVGSPEISLNNGQSENLRCKIEWNLDGPSMRGEIFAETDYKFIKKAGSRTVKVKYRGQ